MKFSTIVEHDDSGLLMVLDALDELREDRFIEGIRSKQRSHYEIMQMTNLVGLLRKCFRLSTAKVTGMV